MDREGNNEHASERLGSTTVARVDLAAGTVTGDGSTSACSHGTGSDDAGTLYNVSATATSVNITPFV